MDVTVGDRPAVPDCTLRRKTGCEDERGWHAFLEQRDYCEDLRDVYLMGLGAQEST